MRKQIKNSSYSKIKLKRDAYFRNRFFEKKLYFLEYKKEQKKEKIIKQIDEFWQRFLVHASCDKEDRYLIQVIYCRFLIEFICKLMLLDLFNRKRTNLKNIDPKSKTFNQAISNVKMKRIIGILKSKKSIGFKMNNTTTFENLLEFVNQTTGECLHIRIDRSGEVIIDNLANKRGTLKDSVESLKNQFIKDILPKLNLIRSTKKR